MKDPKVQAKYFKEFKTKKIYSPTIFWEKLIKKNFNLIIKGDIKNFRNLNAGFVGFAPYFSELKRYKVKQNFINNINKLIENSKIKPKGRKKISFLINSVLTGFERANTQYKLLLTDDIEPKFHEFNESKVGNPTEQFRFNKKFFSASSLNYLNGLLFLKKYIKSFDNKIIMEIGGGFGSVGEILYKLKINNFKYINLDLPPLNIVSEYYLENSCKEIIGNHFLYKKKEKIFINKMRKLNCLPNFDIDKPSIVNEKKSSAKVSLEQSFVEEDLKNKNEEEEQIIQGSEITTVWSMAKAIKGNNDDVSIYQVMWSLYLGNKEAFINENINLVRKDIDIMVPNISDISDVSYQIAKDSIVKMNESFTNNFSNSAKSLLVLTAPKTIENNNDIEPNITSDKPENISIDQPSNPKDIIEQNTKQLSLEVDNKTLDDLVESNNNEGLSNEVNSGFDLFDLLFIALISLASGILLALIFIYLRNIKNSKSIQYDFEEASDDDSNFSPMPSGLSIENDENQQKLDLAITYIEMKDFENATKLLKDILNNCNEEDMKIAAKNLLDKIN